MFDILKNSEIIARRGINLEMINEYKNVKIISLLMALIFSLCLVLCGCSESEDVASSDLGLGDLPKDAQSSDEDTEIGGYTTVGGETMYVDVDLTKLSSIMVYSEVFGMVNEPDTYLGKVVKMSGLFAVSEANGQRYFACIVQDATACCQQGMEFRTKDELSYPGDYPAEGTEITVTGVFSTYLEDGYTYIELQDAILEF